MVLTQTAINYAEAMYEAEFTKEQLADVRSAFSGCPDLGKLLSVPVIPLKEKLDAVDQIFTGKAANLVKLMCQNGCISQILLVCDAYDELLKARSMQAQVVLTCVHPPDEEQLEKIKKFICKKQGTGSADIEIKTDPDILGGFIIQCGDTVYDRSLKGRIEKLRRNLVGEVD